MHIAVFDWFFDAQYRAFTEEKILSAQESRFCMPKVAAGQRQEFAALAKPHFGRRFQSFVVCSFLNLQFDASGLHSGAV